MVAKMNGTTEDAEIRRPQSRILDPIRKKKLMKKLEKMKLNRSRGNNSFFDISALYESKVRKLQNNNVSLAKALAEQRQVSQTWYGEVVSLKEEMQETQEHLLRYRLNEPGNSDAAIQAAAERRIKEIAEPLEFAVQDSLDNVFGLVESMTKVKKLLASLLKINNEKLNYSVRSSRSSGGSRPPLSRTSKSPRKNVVHPMVEGHVLQPASIHIPRMSLEERRRYRLQERAELRQEEDMSVIGEASLVLSEEEPSRENSMIEAEPVEPENSSVTPPLPEEALPSPAPSPASIPIVTGEDLMPRPSPEDSPPRRSFPSSKKGKRQIVVVDTEDPLEGSSWMNTKKRRSSKKKGRSSGGSKRSNPFLLPYIVPSDSEEEIEPPEVLRSSSPKRDLESREESSLNSSLDKSLPTLCLVRLEEFESKVSRRSKKSTSSRASKASRCSRVSGEAENFDVPIPLQSFIINDTLRNTSFESPESQALLDHNLSSLSIPTTPPPPEEAEDVTCLFDSSMEMTQCVTVGLQTAHGASSNHCTEDEAQLKPVRYSKNTNRFFKGFEKEASSPKDSERTPYDLSMMDASSLDVLKKGKENIPPLGEAVSPEASMKLRDVSIVVEDIMKTCLTPDLPPRGTGDEPPQGEAESPPQSSPIKKKRGRKPLKKISLSEGGVGAKTPPPPVAKGRKKAKKEIPKTKAKRSAKLQDTPFDTLGENVCGEPTEEGLEEEEEPSRATSSTPLPQDDVQFSSLPESLFPQRDQPQEDNPLESLTRVSPIPDEHVNETPPRASPTPEDDPFDLPDLMLPFEVVDVEEVAADAASDNSDAEGSVKGRPSRRAASKITSFKEPSLNLKLRQEKTAKKSVKKTRKKSSQKHIPVQS